MRESSVRDPKMLVEPDRISHQGVFLPTAYRNPIIARSHLVRLPRRTAIRIDHAPIPVTAAQQNQNAPQFSLFHELEAIRSMKLPQSARRQAARQWIVFQQRPLPVFVDRLGPR